MGAINLILKDSNKPYLYFIEIEDDEGKSISIGTRRSMPGGLLKIRITIEDIQRILQPKCCDHPEIAWNYNHTKSVCIFCGTKTG